MRYLLYICPVKCREMCGTVVFRVTVKILFPVSCSISRLTMIGSSDGTCRLWDLKTGRVVRHYTGHEKVRLV